MQNFHNTLNESLSANSEKLVALWDIYQNVAYGETKQIFVEDGKKTRLISVYRDSRGMYETALSYITD